MVASRRLVMSFAALVLTMVALVSASGYDPGPATDRPIASHHTTRAPGAFVSTAPMLSQRASLPDPERRVPRSSGFVLLAVVAALLAAVASRAPQRMVDQATVWRDTACGRRGPPVARPAF